MGKDTLRDKIRSYISSIGWKLFIGFQDLTEQGYWSEIYIQEHDRRARHSETLKKSRETYEVLSTQKEKS